MKLSYLVVILGLSGLVENAQAASGGDILKAQCAECHALAKPENATLERLWERRGPDLYYAGSKFKKPWLVAWLQKPTVIRPGGVMYSKLAKPAATADDPDTIDAAQLKPHMQLAPADAEAVATALMELKAAGDLVVKGAFKGEAVNVAFASMLFTKLRGCNSCHASKPGNGGLSGPNLEDAGNRLEPDFVASYIKDPQKFDPHIWMPTLELTDADIQKLTGYIAALQAGGTK